MSKNTTQLILKLMNKLNLGSILSPPIKLTGGLLHTVYKIQLTDKSFVIKHINPEVAAREGALDNILESEKVGIEYSKIITAIPALQINNTIIHELEGQYFIIYNWQNGISLFSENITANHCMHIADILGKLHKLSASKRVNVNVNTTAQYHWSDYLALAKEQGVNWLDFYQSNLERITEIDDLGKIMMKESANSVMSHRDLDPKNVLWHNNIPYIIDWEAAGEINPYVEFVSCLFYWCKSTSGEFDTEKLRIMIDTYKDYSSFRSVDWKGVIYASFSGYISWLDYSIKCALGLVSRQDKTKQQLDQSVVKTIRAIINDDKISDLLYSVLTEKDNINS